MGNIYSPQAMTTKQKNLIGWIFRIAAAAILLQTLFYKFTAAPESVYIFSTLGMEPWGRVGIGAMELVASVLLIIPGATVFGAGLAIGLMSGAIFFHLTKLGLVVQNDSGLLFAYACTVLFCCSVLVFMDKAKLFFIIMKLKKKLF